MVAGKNKKKRGKKKRSIKKRISPLLKRQKQQPELYYFKLPKSKIENEIAPVGKRIVAFIIDMLIFSFTIQNPFMTIYTSQVGIDINSITITYILTNPGIDRIMITALTITSMLLLAYFSIMEGMFGMTIGKYFMRIKVENYRGKNPSIIQAILRNIPKTLLLVLVIDSLGLFGQKKQRFTDMIAGTYVVHTPDMKIGVEQ